MVGKVRVIPPVEAMDSTSTTPLMLPKNVESSSRSFHRLGLKSGGQI
jgi:hypothetical protein